MNSALAIDFSPTTPPEKGKMFQGRSLDWFDNPLADDKLKSLFREFETDRINRFIDNKTEGISFTTPKSEAENFDNTARRISTSFFGAPELSLEPLQEWEGYVTDIGKESFSARLADRTAGRTIEAESADFPIADLSDDDRKLLVVGGVFRWVIGYQRARGGSKRRVSQVTFRRMPSWSRLELAEAAKLAGKLVDTIFWE